MFHSTLCLSTFYGLMFVFTTYWCMLVNAECVDWNVVKDNHSRNEYLINRRTTCSYNCSSPNPKWFAVNQKCGSETHQLGLRIEPPSVILHHCDENAVCCYETQKCRPLTSEKVTLYFKVIYNKSKSDIIAMTFLNHTSCSCK
uniref:U4-Liphistoxin-Lth1a_1 n=1 Tax=Liphistius thaleban TaxID=1905330 RepID=A0A4Q8K255_9ARAC